MAEEVKIKVTRTGRVKAPVLDGGKLTAIGNLMVTEQKQRWSKAVSADGSAAPPLSKKYIFIKAKIRRINRPVRDMNLTGTVLQNFMLRKAINSIVRAEPTSRLAREKARGAERYAQMIGFAPSDEKAVYAAAQKEYGELVKALWTSSK